MILTSSPHNAPPTATTFPEPSSNSPSPAVFEQATSPNGLKGLLAGTQSLYWFPLFGVGTDELTANEASGANL